MGKYRTCGICINANSAKSGGCDNCANNCPSRRSSKKSEPHQLHVSNNTNDGNTWGKFEGNPTSSLGRKRLKESESEGPQKPPSFSFSHKNYQKRLKRRPILVSIYAIIWIVCYLFGNFAIDKANAQPILKVEKATETSQAQNAANVNSNNLILPEDVDQNGGIFGQLGIIVKPNCSVSSADDFPADLFTMEQRRHGAVLIHFIVSVYLFYAILLVCDEYFIPAVECICSEMRIPSDVAGATFMAISTSSPELFTNVIGTFLTDGDLGVGTIVGSAVFNILAMGALCGIGAGYSIHKLANSTDKIGVRLEWWPLTRDSFFYLLAVGSLILILYNRKVYWSEALCMILLYLLYVVVLCFNTRIKQWVEQLVGKFCSVDLEGPRRISVVVGKIISANERTPLLLKVTEKENGYKNGTIGNGIGGKSQGQGQDNNNGKLYTRNTRISSEQDDHHHSHLLLSTEYDIPAESLDEVLVQNALTRSTSNFQGLDEDSNASWCKWSTLPFKNDMDNNVNWQDIISFPIRGLLYLTIPDCKVQAWRKWFWVTLALCVVWIGGLTYLISWMVSIIGDTFGVPDSVTGLTFLAAGTSIPEVISSLIVARQGLGAMGFSNTIGSNTFDILVCLGLPWLLKAALLSSSEVNYVEIHSAGMEYSAILLISALALLYLFIALNGFILDRKIGVACVFMYVVFISLACMLELNVFFPVNLPPC